MSRTVQLRIGRQVLTAGASFCAPCEAERIQAQVAAVTRSQMGPAMTAASPAPELPVDDPLSANWSGTIAVEGSMTGDGRLIEAGGLHWDDLPLPLRWDIEDDGAHAGAVVIGLIETITRGGDGAIMATGFIDLGSANGREAARLIDRGMLRGVSIDPDTVDYEIRVRAELLQAGVPMMDPPEDDEGEDTGEETQEMPAPDAAGYVTVESGASDDEIMVMLDARLRAATLVDIPAFAGATITLDAPLVLPSGDLADVGMAVPVPQPRVGDLSLVAAAAPIRPPAAWFADPRLPALTPMTIDADGRIFGHLAPWNACHVGFESCVIAPRSQTNYSWFRTGILIADDGSEHTVGQITLDTGHAGVALSAHAAVAHYDHTGRAVADVAVGEDAHGIWFAGAMRPGVTETQLRTLRGAKPSGDWRQVGGNLELCHVLAVNMPGFPVPRGMVASGRPWSLLLPGPTALHDGPPVPGPVVVSSELSAPEREALRVLLAAGRRADDERRQAAAELARSVEAGELARLVLTR